MSPLKLIAAVLIFCCAGASGQTGRLYMTGLNRVGADSICYRVFLLSAAGDTVRHTTISNGEFLADSLSPGRYQLLLRDCSQPGDLFLGKSLTIVNDSLTRLFIDLDVTEQKEPLPDSLGISTSRVEGQVYINGFSNSWVGSSSPLTSVLGLGFSGSSWDAFSRHIGALVGYGIGFQTADIARDTTFIQVTGLKKKYEYYNYLDLHLDVTFRFSQGNQQREHEPLKFVVDIGARYNFPLSFRHVVQYEDSKKIKNRGLHQYTDVRVFANIGYSHVLLFGEYRLFDFVLGHYPELPLYNVGLRVIFPATTK